MKTYLVLGARAPAALEICRGLARGGNRVLAADSMMFPVARWTKSVDRYFRLPAAAENAEAYGKALSKIVSSEGVDVILPTCEEVFHLSMSRHLLPKECVVFADDIEKLRVLHDKFAFTIAARDCGIGIPRTTLLRSWRRLCDTWERTMIDCDLVYKRTFSRFAEGTYLGPSLELIGKVRPTPEQPWIAQEFIEGDEVCCYAVAVRGKVTAIAPYRPLHRVGKGAGICFETVRSPQIEAFVSNIVEKLDFTGQISFDFIVDPDRGAYVIECNPRATSGVHLIPQASDWNAILSGDAGETVVPAEGRAMVGAAMATFGLSRAFRSGFRQWVSDFRASSDVVWRSDDKLPSAGQWLATAETLARAIRTGTSALGASTADIEWNGEQPL